MTPVVAISNLSKTFGEHTVVSDLSFTILPGDVYGFLGQNGAGKSTTMRMILGLIRPDSGSIEIKGKSFSAHRRELLRHIGAIIERPDLYNYLSGWDNLRLFANLSGENVSDKRLREVLETVQLTGREKDKVKAYSQGMKQRLGIAIALAHDPDLLILDEPTNGLDPQGIAEMRRLVIHLSRDAGKTVLISSHLLHEMEQMATRMLIMHKGKKVVEGTIQDLLHPDDALVEVNLLPDDDLQSAVGSSPWQPFIKEISAEKLLLQMNPDRAPALNAWLVAGGFRVLQLQSRHSLEAYFLSLTDDVTATAHGAL